MDNLTSLFLSQSYQDTWDDYIRSLNSDMVPGWDYIILTASNQNQAEGYWHQIESRKDFLPSGTHFAVIPDEGGMRVGSGGATLSVLRYIWDREKELTGQGHFDKLRILCIHSGGDSKRVPTYSALGKLFSPVPHKLPDGRSSTLFDEFLISMSSVASRIREGMVLLSGDVLLLFNPLQIDFPGTGAAVISFKENVETGKNHGVFLSGEGGNVKKFLHKQTVETLTNYGAVNDNRCVDIDTGAVVFAPDLLVGLHSLIDTEEKYHSLVNGTVRLSLYGDFLYPLAEDSTIDAFYEEKPEGRFCPELHDARTLVWDVLSPYKMKLLRLAPAKFIHFGTTSEILKLMTGGVDSYAALGWSRKICSSIAGNTAGYNSVLSQRAHVGDDCYLEVSNVHHRATVGSHVVLSYVDIHDETIPDNVVLHGLKQKDGKFVCRIYSVDDNPKENLFFGQSISRIAEKLGVEEKELWDSDSHTLWSANLFPECDTIREAVGAALNVYDIANGRGNLDVWRASHRKSLCSGFNDADPQAIIDWNDRMQELVQMDEILKDIQNGTPVVELSPMKPLTKIQETWLEKHLERADMAEKVRLQFYLGIALGMRNGTPFIQNCFKTVSQAIQDDAVKSLRYNNSCKIVMDRHQVKLPLRVNFGGGWSDTPPICNELGGTVLNAAISLNGELPVEVTLEKIPEHKIVFDSRDMDVHGEFESIASLQTTGDPCDPFALQKACLLACGIIPFTGGSLPEILERMGGGFVMHSEVHNVPKGSGLGTSSILSAACVKAVMEFTGIPYTNDDLYSHTLVMEQIMSTGGGWQDQVGGVTDGIKYITSQPGIHQNLTVEQVKVSPSTLEQLSSRYCLIYTGQRRLARNLLRDVIGRFVGNEPDSLYALNEIQKVAVLMRFELERGNVDEFARLLERHWTLSQKIDKGSTNTLIDQIFLAIDDLIDARMVCGAGGGGFLQVILKKGVTKARVHKRLKEVFQDNPVDVWDSQFV